MNQHLVRWCRGHGSVVKADEDFCEWAMIEDRFLAYDLECDTTVAEVKYSLDKEGGSE